MLEGENAVNIIQQKTAVRAVVEVRDANNLPVPGASVTFTVTGKGGASIAGPSVVSVPTDAAGRAVLSGMTPSSSGGLQISVNAAFKGLTASTTITQTVVATAAAAAAITGAAAGTGAAAAGGATTGTVAAAGGGAAAAGGGLGTAAIVGIVGGAVAVGGGLAASGVLGGEGEDTNTPPPPQCTTTVTPTTLTVPFAGGTFVITVSKTPTGCVPREWAVTEIPSFVTATPTNGLDSGTVTVTVAPFTPTEVFPARSGAMTVASQVITINQPRPVSLLRP